MSSASVRIGTTPYIISEDDSDSSDSGVFLDWPAGLNLNTDRSIGSVTFRVVVEAGSTSGLISITESIEDLIRADNNDLLIKDPSGTNIVAWEHNVNVKSVVGDVSWQMGAGRASGTVTMAASLNEPAVVVGTDIEAPTGMEDRIFYNLIQQSDGSYLVEASCNFVSTKSGAVVTSAYTHARAWRTSYWEANNPATSATYRPTFISNDRYVRVLQASYTHSTDLKTCKATITAQTFTHLYDNVTVPIWVKKLVTNTQREPGTIIAPDYRFGSSSGSVVSPGPGSSITGTSSPPPVVGSKLKIMGTIILQTDDNGNTTVESQATPDQIITLANAMIDQALGAVTQYAWNDVSSAKPISTITFNENEDRSSVSFIQEFWVGSPVISYTESFIEMSKSTADYIPNYDGTESKYTGAVDSIITANQSWEISATDSGVMKNPPVPSGWDVLDASVDRDNRMEMKDIGGGTNINIYTKRGSRILRFFRAALGGGAVVTGGMTGGGMV